MSLRLLEFARKFHAMSPWFGIEEMSEAAVLNMVAALRANPNGYVHETSTGIIGGIVLPLWFSETLSAVELFWYSENPGDGKLLREEFEVWAKEKGATYVQLSCLVNEREFAIRRILSRAGYNAKEVGFVKVI